MRLFDLRPRGRGQVGRFDPSATAHWRSPGVVTWDRAGSDPDPRSLIILVVTSHADRGPDVRRPAWPGSSADDVVAPPRGRPRPGIERIRRAVRAARLERPDDDRLTCRHHRTQPLEPGTPMVTGQVSPRLPRPGPSARSLPTSRPCRSRHDPWLYLPCRRSWRLLVRRDANSATRSSGRSGGPDPSGPAPAAASHLPRGGAAASAATRSARARR